MTSTRPWWLLLLLPLLLLCLGCQPVVTGDRAANPLLGEWQVERTEGETMGKTWSFFLLELGGEGDVRVFNNEYRAGTYAVSGDLLTVRIKGYPPANYTILRREGAFDLRHEPSGATFHLVNANGFEAADFFAPLLIGLVGLALLVPQALALRVFACAGAWPRASATVTSAWVDKQKRPGSARSITPALRFRYAVGDRTFDGSNEAAHNHRAGYSKDEAKEQVERWKRAGAIEVRYDPRRPERVFLGREHFPLASTLSLAALGSLLGVGLAAAFGEAVGWAGYRVVKVGTVDWPVFVVVGALPVYVLASALSSWVLRPRSWDEVEPGPDQPAG